MNTIRQNNRLINADKMIKDIERLTEMVGVPKEHIQISLDLFEYWINKYFD